jgi:pimeloyl-ACP methyl ester carboxylesterase
MLRKVKVPVLFTHHFRKLNPVDGTLMGSVSDLQVDRARRLIEAAGQRFEYHSFPQVGHFLHAENPALYLATLLQWTKSLLPVQVDC